MKEDDMDEMMRKAAENYDVDADKAADWNAVYAAVHGDEEPAIEEKKKRRGFAFWWLFLIPLGWMAHTEYNKFHDDNNKIAANSTATIQSKANGDNSITNKTIENKLADQNQNIKQEKNTTTENNIVPAIKNEPAQNQFSLKQLHRTINNSFGDKKFDVQNNTIADATTNEITAQQKQIQSTQSFQKEITSPNQSNINQSNNIIQEQQNKTGNNIIPAIINDKKDTSAVTSSDQTKIVDQTSMANKTSTANKSSSIKKEKNNSHYFYAGLVAGGDLSFIKYQKSQAVGYNAGILVGYKFNKLSIESGLFLDQKNYYTKGADFDKSKLHYFDNAELLKAYGYCKMFELPLNIKYDISAKKNHTWFATAGLSSYFMNKEFYDFHYIKDGQYHNGSYPYYHTTKDWFSVANVSAGYQLQMPGKINLRIEPYYKLPLSGVGTGSLHITSAGINVGVTRKIP